MLSSEILEFSMLESRLSSRMNTYCSASIHSSTPASIPTPFQPMHPITIKKSPFSLFCTSAPFFFHIYILSSDPMLLIFVSSDQITLVQSSIVQFLYLRANSSLLLFYCRQERLFLFDIAFKDVALRTLWTVWAEIGDGRAGLMRWMAWTAC